MMDFKQEYEPVQAIIIHKNEEKYYLESHNIYKDRSFGIGKPLMKETLANIFQTLSVSDTDRLQFRGMIPKNILFVNNTPGNSVISWTTEPQKVNMNFTKNVGLKDGLFSLPSMLWLVKGNHLSIFALRTNGLSKNSKLYQMPLPNVDVNGGVCWGSGAWPSNERYYEDFIEELMQGFWSSRFSHKMSKDRVKGWNNSREHWSLTMALSPNNHKIKKELGL